MKTRRTKNIWLSLGLILCIAYFLWFNHPFPLEDGSLSKEEAALAALQYFDLDPEEAEVSVIYDVDQEAIAYLQKEQLLDSYLDRYDPVYPLEYYLVEIEMPEDNRYTAHVHLYEGIITAWSRPVPSDIAESSEAAALTAAEAYFRQQRPADLAATETSSLQLPDGSFQIYYEYDHDRIGEAKRTVTVHTAGGAVIAYQSGFTPPSSFLVWLEQQNARAEQFTGLTLWASAALAAAALTIAILYRRSIHWSDGLLLVSITVLIQTIQYMNTLPNYVSLIELRQAGWLLYAFEFIFAASFTAVFCLTVYLPYLGGKALLAREGMSRLLHLRDWNRELRSAVLRGYGFGFLILAVQTVIFQVGRAAFDIWWIPDPSLSTENMLWPLLMPLTAWAAAISEEIIYRLFAVTLFKKLFRSTFLAVLLSSMLWGLGHTAYPVYPVYTRFIEVTIIGILFGYLFIRFGFAAAVFAHAVVDSVLMGFDVAGMGIEGLIAACVYIALPGVIGWLLARRPPMSQRSSPAYAPPDLPPR